MLGWSGGSSGQTFNPMNGGEGGTFNPDGGDRAPFNPQGGSWAPDNGVWPNWYPPQGASGQTFYPGSYWNGGGGGARGPMWRGHERHRGICYE